MTPLLIPGLPARKAGPAAARPPRPSGSSCPRVRRGPTRRTCCCVRTTTSSHAERSKQPRRSCPRCQGHLRTSRHGSPRHAPGRVDLSPLPRRPRAVTMNAGRASSVPCPAHPGWTRRMSDDRQADRGRNGWFRALTGGGRMGRLGSGASRRASPDCVRRGPTATDGRRPGPCGPGHRDRHAGPGPRPGPRRRGHPRRRGCPRPADRHRRADRPACSGGGRQRVRRAHARRRVPRRGRVHRAGARFGQPVRLQPRVLPGRRGPRRPPVAASSCGCGPRRPGQLHRRAHVRVRGGRSAEGQPDRRARLGRTAGCVFTGGRVVHRTRPAPRRGGSLQPTRRAARQLAG